jgi:hypothetical protein
MQNLGASIIFITRPRHLVSPVQQAAWPHCGQECSR